MSRVVIVPIGPRQLEPGTLHRVSATLPREAVQLPELLVPDYVRRDLTVVAVHSGFMRQKPTELRLSLFITSKTKRVFRGSFSVEVEP